jgi:hypothetical protein
MLSFLQTRSFFNPETPSVSDESPLFTPVEQKLIRLGLDAAAHEGESDVCAIKLFRSLRKRGLTAEQLMRSSAQSIWAARELMAARGRVVTFGKKYRGRTLGEVPGSYLQWALENYRDLPLNVRAAIQLVLDQGIK